MKNSAVKEMIANQLTHVDRDDIEVEFIAVVNGEYEFKVIIQDTDVGYREDLSVFIKMVYAQ